MKRNKTTNNRRNEEDQKKLHAFLRAMERYRKGKKLRTEEQRMLDKLIRSEQEEPAKMDARNAREVSEAVWNRLEKVIIKGDQAGKKAGGVVRTIRLSYQAVAAVFVLFISISALITWRVHQKNVVKEVQLVADNQVRTVLLPDSTVVYLNVKSSLAYNPKTFNTDKRRVDLVGEAFFKVKKDPEKLFLVYGGELVTIVRGTSFNVKAYPEVNNNVVSVRDGVVEVSTLEQGQALATLVCNQQMSWDTEANTGRTDRIDWQEAGGWIDGKTLVLNSAGLDEIILKVSRYYRIELTVSGVAPHSVRLRGSYPVNDQGRALIRQMCDIYTLKCDSTSNSGQVKLYR
ncbi:MAG: FecR family protein [Mangrovibacterium sp.]